MSDFASWDRQPGEPELWYHRFDDYARTFGMEFTVERALLMFRLDMQRKTGSATPEFGGLDTWRVQATTWHWAERAMLWAAEDTVLRKTRWEVRRQELLEADWDVGGQLRRLGQEFLKVMKVTKQVGTGPDGETLLAVGATPSQVAQLLKTASEIQRLAIGEPTDIFGQNNTIGPRVYLPEVKKEVRDESIAS
jgi:hypothetical protein